MPVAELACFSCERFLHSGRKKSWHSFLESAQCPSHFEQGKQHCVLGVVVLFWRLFLDFWDMSGFERQN
jgi:hypothetical protein